MAIEDFSKITYKVRCPFCGEVYTYKLKELLFEPGNALGYTECPTCHQKIQHTLSTPDIQEEEIISTDEND